MTRGKVALVDDDDYQSLSQHRWHTTSAGYAARTAYYGKGVRAYIPMHRQVLGFPSAYHIDHADGNPLNNCRANLRACTASENQGNRRQSAVKHGRRPSVFKGVWFNAKAGKWQAGMTFRGQKVHIGVFADEIAAALAYDRAAQQAHGAFARLNFPNAGRDGSAA